jgi:hypothetical protein
MSREPAVGNIATRRSVVLGAAAGVAGLVRAGDAGAQLPIDDRYVLRSRMPFNVKDYDATGDGTTDDRDAVRDAFTAAEAAIVSTGSAQVVYFPPGVYKMGSGGGTSMWAIRQGLPAFLIARGDQATIKLTSACPRAFDCDRTADHQVFRNIWIEGLVVDAGNVGGKGQVLFGSYGGTSTASQSHLQYDTIVIRDCKVLNVPTSTDNSSFRLGIWMMIAHDGPREATQDSARNIYVQDVEVQGGQAAVFVGGGKFSGGANEAGYNQYVDNVNIERCRHVQPQLIGRSVGDGTAVWGASFHVGSTAFGGRVRISDCYSYGIGDVAVEVNAIRDCIVQNCVADEAAGYPFYWTNYNWPALARTSPPTGAEPSVSEQVVRFVNCHCRNVDGEVYGSAFRANTFQDDAGRVIGLGRGLWDKCSVYRRRPSSPWNVKTGVGFGVNANIREVRIIDPEVTIEGVSYSHADAPIVSAYYLNLAQLGGGSEPSVRLVRPYVKMSGERTGGGAFAAYLVLCGGRFASLHIDDLLVDFNVSGMSDYTVAGVNFVNDSVVRGGRIRGCQVLQLVGDSRARAIKIPPATDVPGGVHGLDVLHGFVIEDCDFGACSSDQVEVGFSDDSNKPKVFLRGNRWRVFPREPYSLSVAANGSSKRYVEGYAGTIVLTGGNGTTVEVSHDNSTWRKILDQPAGAFGFAFRIENGEYYKLGYSTAPTATVRPQI